MLVSILSYRLTSGLQESRVWDPETQRERRKAVFTEEEDDDDDDDSDGSSEEEGDEEGESEEEDEGGNKGGEEEETVLKKEAKDKTEPKEKQGIKTVPPVKRQKMEERKEEKEPVVEVPAFADSEDELEMSEEEEEEGGKGERESEGEESDSEGEEDEEDGAVEKGDLKPIDSGHCSEEEDASDSIQDDCETNVSGKEGKKSNATSKEEDEEMEGGELCYESAGNILSIQRSFIVAPPPCLYYLFRVHRFLFNNAALN